MRKDIKRWRAQERNNNCDRKIVCIAIFDTSRCVSVTREKKKLKNRN